MISRDVQILEINFTRAKVQDETGAAMNLVEYKLFL